MFATNLGVTRFRFDDLKSLLAAASPDRSGDRLAGIGADSASRRVAARMILADLPVTHFLQECVIPYEHDEVTRLIMDNVDRTALNPIAHMTVGEFREWLLSAECDSASLSRLAPSLTPEMIAGVSKIMRNQDLVVVEEMPRRYQIPKYHRPGRAPFFSPSAESSYRFCCGNSRVDYRRASLWRRRCCYWHQSGQ